MKKSGNSFELSATDLVAYERRRQLKMDQATLARRVGASRRQWVIEIERGHPRAELGLVLRTLDVLGIKIDAENGRPQTNAEHTWRRLEQAWSRPAKARSSVDG